MSKDRASKRHIVVALLGSRGIPARYGGFETVVEELANRLPESRFHLYVACESSLRGLIPPSRSARPVYFPVWERTRTVSEVGYDALSLIWSALADVDVVLVFGYAASIFFLFPRLLGKMVIANVDGLEWKRRKFSRFVRWALKVAEAVAVHTATLLVCDSRAIGKYYREKYRVSPYYIPILARPCDPETSGSVRDFCLEPRGYYSVVARLEPENNVHVIIEGFKQSDSARKLAIVGPPTPTDYFNTLFAGRNNRVLFLGGVYERSKLMTIRKDSFAYIHGHEVGGTNPSLLEAMSCGNPVLALDVPFNREVAEDSALYFTSSSELADRIRALESDPDQAARMGERGKRIAEERYSAAIVVREYEELLSSRR